MPWEHCGAPAIPDTDTCPSCGIGKAQWTLAFDVTRQFTVRRRSALRLALVDAGGQGVAGEPYRLEPADGEPLEGVLDELGQASHSLPGAGDCTVVFPRRRVGAVLPLAEEGDASAVAGGEPVATGAGPATFVRAAGRRHRFQLARNPRWSAARCRFDEVVELLWDLPGVADGAPVELEVFEHDADGEHDLVARAVVAVRDGQARLRWHVPRVDDADDVPTPVDEAADFALPEFFFVARHGDVEARCEELLIFATDLELPLEGGGGRRLANTAYF
jgi:hypothetical protein